MANSTQPNKNTSGLERELYRYLRNNSCTISFFKKLHQLFTCSYISFDPTRTIHKNLRRRCPYDYYSPKHIFWIVTRPWRNGLEFDESVYWDKQADKWYNYYKQHKLCSKHCIRKGSYIEEKFSE